MLLTVGQVICCDSPVYVDNADTWLLVTTAWSHAMSCAFRTELDYRPSQVHAFWPGLGGVHFDRDKAVGASVL